MINIYSTYKIEKKFNMKMFIITIIRSKNCIILSKKNCNINIWSEVTELQ